jgi:uncharacterized protein YidB (DUF937 family)
MLHGGELHCLLRQVVPKLVESLPPADVCPFVDLVIECYDATPEKLPDCVDRLTPYLSLMPRAQLSALYRT